MDDVEIQEAQAEHEIGGRGKRPIKDKLYKVAIRRVPLQCSEELLVQCVHRVCEELSIQASSCGLAYYVQGKLSAKRGTVYGVGYLWFSNICDANTFVQKCGNEVSFFPDVEAQPSIVFAPYQKAIKAKFKPDHRCGTIDKDEDFLSFQAAIEAGPQKLPPAADVWDERKEEAKQLMAKQTNPLLQYMRERALQGSKGPGSRKKIPSRRREDRADGDESTSSNRRGPKKRNHREDDGSSKAPAPRYVQKKDSASLDPNHTESNSKPKPNRSNAEVPLHPNPEPHSVEEVDEDRTHAYTPRGHRHSHSTPHKKGKPGKAEDTRAQDGEPEMDGAGRGRRSRHGPTQKKAGKDVPAPAPMAPGMIKIMKREDKAVTQTPTQGVNATEAKTVAIAATQVADPVATLAAAPAAGASKPKQQWKPKASNNTHINGSEGDTANMLTHPNSSRKHFSKAKKPKATPP